MMRHVQRPHDLSEVRARARTGAASQRTSAPTGDTENGSLGSWGRSNAVQFKSKISPEDHFALYAKVARELASRLPPGPERYELIRRADAASQLEGCSLGVQPSKQTTEVLH